MSKKQENIENQITSNEYSIYNYLLEHTGFLMAILSAVVAIVSFTFNYIIEKYNCSYLDYWLIDSVYISNSNKDQFYTVLFSFLFVLAILMLYGLFSRTSDIYGNYNKIRSVLNWQYKRTKKIHKDVKRTEKMCVYSARKYSSEASEPEEFDKLVKDAKENREMVLEVMKHIKRERNELKKIIYINVLITAFVSYIIGVPITFLLLEDMKDNKLIFACLLMTGFVFLNLFIFFLPTYFFSRCKKNELEEFDIKQYYDEINENEKDKFPIQTIVKNGWKSMVSNENLKKAAIGFFLGLLILMFSMKDMGRNEAASKRVFPIYKADMGTYVVVYNNGESLFMESAKIDNGKLIVDVSKQRIVKSNDILYEIKTFKEVTRVGIENIK